MKSLAESFFPTILVLFLVLLCSACEPESSAEVLNTPTIHQEFPSHPVPGQTRLFQVSILSEYEPCGPNSHNSYLYPIAVNPHYKDEDYYAHRNYRVEWYKNGLKIGTGHELGFCMCGGQLTVRVTYLPTGQQVQLTTRPPACKQDEPSISPNSSQPLPLP